jgi:glucuronate isomerase
LKKPFMDENFLLNNDTARTLYHQYAAQMPIVDYHCHIDPREIYEDRIFRDMTEIWLGGDHYKWRALRSDGVEERYITGDALPYEKFERWARVMPRMIGNQLYHWTHLELQRYFGISEPLSPCNAQAIWEKGNAMLPGLSARTIIKKSRVKAICTTDDPADDLQWHRLIKEDQSFSCLVLPTFRPDKAMNIDKPGYTEYLLKLGRACGFQIDSLAALKEALRMRLAFFVESGCRITDHGLDYVVFKQGHDADQVLQNALAGKAPTREQADAFKTDLLCYLAGLYREHGIVMQLHFGAVRNNSPKNFKKLGPDTGYDAIWGSADTGYRLGSLLGHIEEQVGLPKTIIYSLNPADDAQIDAMIACFQDASYPGKIQHGSAWWFNDSKEGMTAQIKSLANLSVLGNFVGMLTDSRSFLSYTRHEYFRRILCNLLGTWVENGEYPDDMDTLGNMVKDICFNNAVNYLGLEIAE